MSPLIQFTPDIYIKEYPIYYGGCSFFGRMTIIRLEGGKLILHSPCQIDDEIKNEIYDTIGHDCIVSYIIAPGNFHHLYIESCQKNFPNAKTYICPNLNKKRPDINYDGILPTNSEREENNNDTNLLPFMNDTKNVLKWIEICGNKLISELAFFHIQSKTLILVDSIEYIGDETPGTNWWIKFWWIYVFKMWNKPKPAPEYQMFWNDKVKAKGCMKHILEDWDFNKIIIAHGENITSGNAKEMVYLAWRDILEYDSEEKTNKCFCF